MKEGGRRLCGGQYIGVVGEREEKADKDDGRGGEGVFRYSVEFLNPES